VLSLALLLIGGWLWSEYETEQSREAPVRPSPAVDERADPTVLNTALLSPPRAVAPIQAPLTHSVAKTAPQAAALARVFGTIRDAETRATMANYTLQAFGEHMDGKSTSSDAAGHYEFLLEPGTCYVGGSQQGRRAWCESLELQAGDERQLDRNLGDSIELCVRVWSRNQEATLPLLDAQVTLVEADANAFSTVGVDVQLGVESVTTDRDGFATIDITEFAKLMLVARAPGFLPSVVGADFSPHLSYSPIAFDGCLHIVLEPEGPWVFGRILDAAGGPVEGAVVFCAARVDPMAEPTKAKGSRVGERHAQALESRHPAFVRSDAGGDFRVRAPLATSLEIVVLPRRADLIHHFAQPLDPRDVRFGVVLELRLPEAWPIELEIVDATGAPQVGFVSVRDEDGRAHAPHGALSDDDFVATTAGRRFPLQQGRLRVLHPGGLARIGLSPQGRWRAGEIEVRLPAGPRTDALRIVLP
jgi:hypothetical protein